MKPAKTVSADLSLRLHTAEYWQWIDPTACEIKTDDMIMDMISPPYKTVANMPMAPGNYHRALIGRNESKKVHNAVQGLSAYPGSGFMLPSRTY